MNVNVASLQPIDPLTVNMEPARYQTGRKGTGTMTWPDGRKYVGQFRDGKMDGTGKMTYPNGKIEEGLWREGKFMGAGRNVT